MANPTPAAAGTLRHRSEPSPALTVVLPVLNEARDIGRVLEELRRQTPPPGGFEVIVADGGSTDETRDIVRSRGEEWPELRLLENPGKLSSAGRNVGAWAARGTHVLFLDGHCELPRDDYLTRLMDIFDSTGATCLSRPQPMTRLTDGPWAEAISQARHSWLGHNPGSDIYGGDPGFTDPRHAGAAYERTCLENLGGYDERFDACEDVEFNHRVALAGLRSYRHPDLTVNYRPRSDLKGFFRQLFRYGRGRARLMVRHPSVVPWPVLLVAIAVGVLPLMLLALDVRIGLMWITAIAVGWLLIAGGESIRLVGLKPAVFRVTAAFAAVHAGLVLGFYRGVLEFRRFRAPLIRVDA